MEQNTDNIPQGDLLSHLDNLDLTSVRTDRPVVKEGTYAFDIKGFEAKMNSKNTGHNLNIALAGISEMPTNDGKSVSPGFVLFDLVSLVKTDKYNPAEKLAKIQEAVYGAKQNGFKTAEMVGQRVMLKVTIEDSEEFGQQNRVKWIKKTASA